PLGADRLQQPHYRADRVLRLKTEKQMDMILVHLQFLNLKSVMPRNLPKQFPAPLPNRPLQHPFPILGRPHQMIAGVVHTGAGSSDGHATTSSGSLLPPAARIFPPRPSGQGIHMLFFVIASSRAESSNVTLCAVEGRSGRPVDGTA